MILTELFTKLLTIIMLVMVFTRLQRL